MRHDVTKDMRTFRPDVCCEHEWEHSEVCTLCGATCVRDKDGKIEEYEAGNVAYDR